MSQSPYNAKHTPGPWELDEVSLCIYGGPKDGPCFRLADCGAADDDNIPDEQVEANARLIASAPELLEALKAIIKQADYGSPLVIVADPSDPDGWLDHESIQTARAAIAKAEGSEIPHV